MTETQGPNYGKAGRNLPAATAVGVSLITVLVISLFVLPSVFVVLVALAIVLAVREMFAVLVKGASQRLSVVTQIGAVAIVAAASTGNLTVLLASYVGSIVAVFSVRLLDGQEAYVHHVTRAIFALTYAPLLASFAVLLSTQENGAWKVLTFVLLTAGSDLGGYIAGVFFGKHALAPRISPKKSWEGLAGGLVLQCAVGAYLFPAHLGLSWWQGVVVGILMTVTAVTGDLIESMIKRDLGIKDMGTLLPGHGGVMDRLDALLVNAFIAWLAFAILLGTTSTS